MKIIILSVGKTRDGHLAALADRYFQRISPFLKAGLEIAPESKDGNAARKVEREGKEILKKIRERDFVVVLDEGGGETDSLSFARWLSEMLDGTDGRIFCHRRGIRTFRGSTGQGEPFALPVKNDHAPRVMPCLSSGAGLPGLHHTQGS